MSQLKSFQVEISERDLGVFSQNLLTLTFKLEDRFNCNQFKKQDLKMVTFLLSGDLGSGKTTFTKSFVKTLGIKAKVSSPTFVIEKIYKNSNFLVKHLDLYRLNNVSEEIWESMTDSCVDFILVEWFERFFETNQFNNFIFLNFKNIEKDKSSRSVRVESDIFNKKDWNSVLSS